MKTDDNGRDPLARRERWIDSYAPTIHIQERGRVVSVGDGIVRITGLPSAAMDDLLEFDDGSRGVVFDLDEQLIGAVLLHVTDSLTAGTSVYRSGEQLSLPVGDELLGRVIDPLGNPLDDAPEPNAAARQSLQSPAPPILARDFVHSPLYTGIKMIDTLVPIGKGQRQLLLGDDGLGRSSIAIDTVINQHDKDVLCVYVLVGQKRSAVTSVMSTLRDAGALDYTTIVVSEASSLPGLQYLAPFAGCSVAEYWMQQGRDTLVVYDDLTSHARTYRALSLLLRRPPGREAYPGDIFSLHARLLERATCLNAGNGGGSMTALPIVETNEGEIAAYIPTNLISITDGQIYLDRELFAAGFRPAIDIGRSVSRIGGAAQHPRIKEEAGRIKLDYLQFLELEVFTRFGAKIEASMAATIKRGRVLRELLKQERLNPLPAEFQLAWLVAFNDSLLTEVDIEELPGVLSRLRDEVDNGDLTLDDDRDEWSQWVAARLGVMTTGGES